MIMSLAPSPFTSSPRQVLEGTKRTYIAGDDVLWLTFDSTANGLSHFYQFVDFLKRAWSIDELTFANIYSALSEAATNSVEHGNKWEEGKSIYLNAKRDSEYYTFTIEDEGDGFNYHKIENPTDRENRDKPGGRGIFIMNYMADKVRFSENGRCVKLVFRNSKIIRY